MRQFIGKVRDDTTVRDLLVSVAPEPVRRAAAEVDRTELAMMERETEQDQLDYAQALADWGDVGGYEWETLWDVCTVAALGTPFERAQWRQVSTLSGGEQKRVVLEALLRGPDEVLVLDEPDNYLDVPAKRWLEDAARRVAQDRAVRQPRPRAARPGRHPHRDPRAEPRRQHGVGAPRAVLDATTRPGPTATTALDELRQALGRGARQAQGAGRHVPAEGGLQRRHGLAAAGRRDPAAAASRRPGRPRPCRCARRSSMRLTGGRTAKRAVVATGLELRVDGGQLMRPFDTEIWFGERVGVLGSNGSGKSHFLRLLAAGGSDPDREHEPVGDIRPAPVEHEGRVVLGSRVRPGLVRADPRPRGAARAHAARDPAPRRRPPRRDAARPRRPRARPLRPGPGVGADLRLALGWAAGPAADPAARAVGGDAAAARRADRQPRPALGRGPRGRPGRVRGHGARRDPRPLVRPRARPLPRLPAPTAGSCESTSRCGTRGGSHRVR